MTVVNCYRTDCIFNSHWVCNKKEIDIWETKKCLSHFTEEQEERFVKVEMEEEELEKEFG